MTSNGSEKIKRKAMSGDFGVARSSELLSPKSKHSRRRRSLQELVRDRWRRGVIETVFTEINKR